MISVIVQDLAAVDADAVVRPSDTHLKPASAEAHRLDSAGGEAFAKQRTLEGQLDIGAAVVTDAGELGADFVIHAVIVGDDDPISSVTTQRALRSVLERAKQWQLVHVALAPLGCGPGQLDFDHAARLMLQELKAHLAVQEYPSRVTIAVRREAERDALHDLLELGGTQE